MRKKDILLKIAVSFSKTKEILERLKGQGVSLDREWNHIDTNAFKGGRKLKGIGITRGYFKHPRKELFKLFKEFND